MTTEVQKHEDQSPAIYAGTGGAFDASDYSIPFVALVQASSEAVKDGKAKPGIFMASDGEQYESIDFVPLHVQFTRDFYNADKAKAICGSNDRMTGHPRDLTFFRTEGNLDLGEGDPLACRDCPFEALDYGKLACKKGYTVTGYDLTTATPFLFRVRGTAVNVFKHRFVGAVAMGRTAPWGRAFTMTSAKQTNGGNSWFAPDLTPLKGYTPEEQNDWAAYAAQFGKQPVEQHVDMDLSEDLPFDV